MRSTLRSAACVAALLAGPALAQEAQLPTAEGTADDTATAQATTPTEGVATTDETLTAEGADAADDAATGTELAEDAGDADAAMGEETQTAQDATATDGAATDGTDATQTAEGADVQVTTTEDETATAATEEPAVENTAQTSAESPDAGAAVTTTTEGSTEEAEAEPMPLPSDPQEALAMAAAQLDEAMNQYGAGATVGTDAAATGDSSVQTIDRDAQEQITSALDQFDQALGQYGESSSDEQVQEQIVQLQAQTQQAREQLEDDPAGAMQSIDQLTQAALTLPQSEIPAEADSIIEARLVSSDGEEVGEISNVLVTAEGQVEAILVSRGGALGLGGSDVLVPWEQIQIQGDQIMVNMTRDEMEQLPDYVTD